MDENNWNYFAFYLIEWILMELIIELKLTCFSPTITTNVNIGFLIIK